MCAADITVDWICAALGHHLGACRPTSIEADQTFAGPSLLGRVVRVGLRYATPGCSPSSVVVKFQARPTDWEARIYRLLSTSDLPGVPKLFATCDDGTLLMEDLSALRPGSQLGGFNLDQVRKVLALLAEVHSRYWGDPHVPSLPADRFVSVIQANMAECWDLFITRYRDLLGDTATDFQWMWSNAADVSSHRLSEPATLFHGDVHPENILFHHSRFGRPVLLDWQLAGRGLAANDVSFLLIKSMSAELRRAHEDRLLREYLAQLPRLVRHEYPLRTFKLDYRACATRSMVSAVMLVGPKFADRPDQLKLADAVASRVIAAVRDLRPVQAMQQLGRTRSPKE